METCSTWIFSFCIIATAKVKPLPKSLDPNLQGATSILIFFKKLDYYLGSAKNETKQKLFLAPCRPHPLFFNMSQDFVFSYSCTRVHEFEEKTKFHVRGYMDLKKKQNSVYPVHGWEEKTKFHVPRYMNLRKQNFGTFKKKGVGAAWSQKKILFCFFFCRP